MCQGTCQHQNRLPVVGQLIASLGPTQHESQLVENDDLCLSVSLRLRGHHPALDTTAGIGTGVHCDSNVMDVRYRASKSLELCWRSGFSSNSCFSPLREATRFGKVVGFRRTHTPIPIAPFIHFFSLTKGTECAENKNSVTSPLALQITR